MQKAIQNLQSHSESYTESYSIGLTLKSRILLQFLGLLYYFLKKLTMWSIKPPMQLENMDIPIS